MELLRLGYQGRMAIPKEITKMRTIPYSEWPWGALTRLAARGSVVAVAVLFCCGCASMFQRPELVTVAQILEMSKAGKPAADIVNTIRDSDTVFRLKASELTELQNQGVPAAVIDYMQETYLDSVKQDAMNATSGPRPPYGMYWRDRLYGMGY